MHLRVFPDDCAQSPNTCSTRARIFAQGSIAFVNLGLVLSGRIVLPRVTNRGGGGSVEARFIAPCPVTLLCHDHRQCVYGIHWKSGDRR